MKTLLRAATALPLLALAAAASAQLKLVTPGQTQTVTFDASQGWNDGVNDNDVLRTWGSAWSGGANENDAAVRLTEPNAWDYSEFNSGGSGLSTRAWRVSGFPGGAGTFGDDFNGNSATDDAPNIFQFAVVDGTSFMGTDPFASKALYFARDTWADKEIVLRVLNATGETVPSFQIDLDTWFKDEAMNVTNLNVSVSSDDTTYTALASRASTNTNAGWSTLQTIGGLTNTSVASGGYLFIKIAYDQNGRGNGFAFDNLSVTPVPEPASMAVLGLGLAAFRKRRRK